MDTNTTPTPAKPAQPVPKLRSLEEALSECQRELQVRERCFPKWVQDGKLSGIDARDRLERLVAAVEYLQRQFELSQVT